MQSWAATSTVNDVSKPDVPGQSLTTYDEMFRLGTIIACDNNRALTG